MTINDAEAENEELAARLGRLEEAIARKDEQIAQLTRDLATTKEETKAATGRLLRQFGELAAVKNGQIAECLYHLNRINASAWWRLGKSLEKLLLVPNRIISTFASKNDAPQNYIADHTYSKWIELYDTISERDREDIRRRILALEYKPLISIVLLASDVTEKVFRETIASVRKQLYPNWELCVAEDASSSPIVSAVLKESSALDPRIKASRRESIGHSSAAGDASLALATGEFVALMGRGDILAEQALYEIVAELNNHPEADIIYSDEDRINSDGRRHSPYFKTDWNPELFLQRNMISNLGVYRRALIEKTGAILAGDGGSRDYDLALRAVSVTPAEKIKHIAAVLYHRRADNVAPSEGELANRIESQRAKKEYFARRGEVAEVVEHPLAPGCDRIRRPIPSPAPLVSLIVPTRNRDDLLEPCIEGLLHRTSYPNIEIIIVDHQSDDAKAIALLDRLKTDAHVRVIPYEGPFNYSDMNNKAAAEARGEIIGLINNDIDVIERDWLSEMVSLAVLPENGVIGAKLLYPNGRVQHGGIILGLPWGIDHVNTNAGRDEAGYFGRLVLTTNVSAVTGACLVLRRALFEEVGGLNALDLQVAYSDIDLCLKVAALGYRNVWTPFALLYHHESPTRGLEITADKLERESRELEYMRRKWGHMFEVDPYFNVNLSLQNPSFALAFPPRKMKSW